MTDLALFIAFAAGAIIGWIGNELKHSKRKQT